MTWIDHVIERQHIANLIAHHDEMAFMGRKSADAHSFHVSILSLISAYLHHRLQMTTILTLCDLLFGHFLSILSTVTLFLLHSSSCFDWIVSHQSFSRLMQQQKNIHDYLFLLDSLARWTAYPFTYIKMYMYTYAFLYIFDEIVIWKMHKCAGINRKKFEHKIANRMRIHHTKQIYEHTCRILQINYWHIFSNIWVYSDVANIGNCCYLLYWSRVKCTILWDMLTPTLLNTKHWLNFEYYSNGSFVDLSTIFHILQSCLPYFGDLCIRNK